MVVRHVVTRSNEEFKKTEKLQEKPIRIINFLPLNAPIEKYG